MQGATPSSPMSNQDSADIAPAPKRNPRELQEQPNGSNGADIAPLGKQY